MSDPIVPDAHGRLYCQLGAVPGTGWLYSMYTYDPYGRLSKITYPSGRSVSNSYDAEGRVSQVTTQPQSGSPVSVLASDFVYGYPFSGPQSFSYGNGTGFYQSRNQDYRPWVRADGPYQKYYGYDAAGNLTNLNNTALTYAYDATGRLVSAVDTASNGFGSLAWTYDLNGNRQSETRNAGTMPYVYSPPNWLYQKGAETRPRTANGNTQSTSTASFTYDGYNRLISSQTAAETTTYTYNALGQRIRKINQNGLATGFHYGPDGELLYEQDQAGNTKAYVWLNGRPLARIDNNQQIYYYHVDHLGTVQSMTDATTGAVVWKGYYEPFGSATVKVNTVENNLRLPGQYYDRGTGLHYNYFRDYDPSTGRYVEADPIGLEGGMNIYSYVFNRPTVLSDLLGLDAFMCTKPLHALGGAGEWLYGHDAPLLYHQYICVKNGKATVCGGQDRSGGPYSPGTPSKDVMEVGRCEKKDDRPCMDKCLTDAIKNPRRPYYGLIGPGTNCQEWANETYSQCVTQCHAK